MPITPIQDKTINRQVQAKIAGRGLGSPCRIAVLTLKGEVTLTGSVQYAQQKITAVQAANGVSGVKRVVDRLVVKAVAKY
jgi:osmotically-inducible protein OsmY